MNLSSNLKSLPSFLEIVTIEGGEGPEAENVNYGFDNNGMWFYGDNYTGISYPIRTNFDYATDEIAEVNFTVVIGNSGGGELNRCSDQGICFFQTGIQPEWQWGADSTRIAFQFNCGRPELFGAVEETHADIGVTNGDIVTTNIVYDSSRGVTAKIYFGPKIKGDPIATLHIDEILPEGNYRIGFDADKDEFEGDEKSYFTSLTLGHIEPIMARCSNICQDEVGFNCATPTSEVGATCSCRKWRLFYANCPKSNFQCSRESKAYLPAITVCKQQLF